MQKSKIVFLDAATVDWKDQKFHALKKMGQVKIYSQTLPSQILARCRGFKHVITNKVAFNRQTILALRDVKAIHVAATGVNIIDLKAAQECGMVITNVRGYSTESVTQMTWTFILALVSRAREYESAIKRRAWSRQPFFALTTIPFNEIAGKTLAIIGFGTIGKRVAEIGKSFGMNILVAKIPGRTYPRNQKRVALHQALQRADVISIHTPLSDYTRNLIAHNELQLLKKTAFLINMARGGIVDERALASALKSRKIAGAATDVLAQEPPAANHPMYNVPNLILTPHIGWASVEARDRLINEIAENIRSFDQGQSRNRLVS